jgi:hypothetical protein
MTGKFLLESQPGQLHGEVKTTLVTVSGGPTPLPEIPLKSRKDFLVYNSGNQNLFVGGPNVTSASGIPVAVDGSFAFQAGRAAVYGTVSGTNQVVRVMEVS